MKVLITGAFNANQEKLEKIKNLGFQIEYLKDERTKTDIDFSDIDIVICNALFLYHDIRQFTNLKAIQLTSVGLDRVPLNYIKEHNIRLYNAKDVYSIPMAEWTILKILEIYKKTKFFYRNQNEKIWEKNRKIFELNGKVATILGFGNVGKQIAMRLKAFNVKINAVGKDYSKIENQYIDKYFESEYMLNAVKDADILIVTLPLNKETERIIDKEYFTEMKDNSVLINVSRGKIINEKDLIEFIHKDKFIGVALDVFENEPLDKNSELWDNEKVIITPHNSFVSENNDRRLFELIFNNLLDLIKT